MGYKDPTYVIFDGDEDRWAYAYMKGWKANEKIDFDFRDAHDLDTMTSRAQGEDYVKRNLRSRLSQSKTALVLIGAKTKNLFKFVRWEMEVALSLDLPIIAVNLGGSRQMNSDNCPAIIRGACVVHIPFKQAAIRHALDNWPAEYARLSPTDRALGARYYNDTVYRALGL